MSPWFCVILAFLFVFAACRADADFDKGKANVRVLSKCKM